MPAYVSSLAEPGDVILTLGAGDIWRYSRQLVSVLGEGTTSGVMDSETPEPDSAGFGR